MTDRPAKKDMLVVGDDFSLPPATVTETLAFLGKRGGGKSSAAVVLAEQMFAHHHQWVAIDPKGDWYGIRASQDGTAPGLPVLVLGGRHGDLPLDSTAGSMLAQLIVERDLTVVLDVSLFSKAEQIRFVTDFADTLFRKIGDDPRPLHLFLEEAEEFLPQRVDARAARMVGAYSKIAKQGRNFGLGVSLITQRSASLNKDALSQTDTLILFRTGSPHDRKAVVAWADFQGEAGEIASSLSSLAPGESWVLSPGFLGETRRVHWHRRSTFDSGATPVTGAKRRREPVSLADIDLGEIREMMAETVEKAEADDPKALRKKIKALELELAAKPVPAAGEIREVEIEVPVEVVVEVPTIPGEVVAIVDDAVRIVEEFGSDLSRLTDKTLERHRSLLELRSELTKQQSAAESAVPVRRSPQAPTPAERAQHRQSRLDPRTRTAADTDAELPSLHRPPVLSPAQRAQQRMIRMKGTDSADIARPVVSPGHLVDIASDDDVKLGKRERSILTVLAQYPEGRTHRQIALLTGYSPKSSTISAGLSNLRKNEYVTTGGKVTAATPEGIAALGDFEVLPQGPDLLRYWLSELGQRERLFLQVLVDAYPAPVGRTDLADAGGYSEESSTVSAGMSKLRGLGLVDGWAASDDFMDSIA